MSQVNNLRDMNRERLLLVSQDPDLEDQLELERIEDTEDQVNQVRRRIIENDMQSRGTDIQEENFCDRIYLPCCAVFCVTSIVSALAVSIFGFSESIGLFNPSIMPLN